jgi:flagellar basal-body rod protein FlgB
MALDLDSYLGIHPEALKLQARRMEVLADNLANVDTPNYKARDIDFQAALAAATGQAAAAGQAGATAPAAATSTGGSALADSPVALATTDPRHIGAGTAEASPELKYRVPLAPSLDGNTVDSELEQAAFAENTVRYQATLTFISTSLRNLMTAITGS